MILNGSCAAISKNMIAMCNYSSSIVTSLSNLYKYRSYVHHSVKFHNRSYYLVDSAYDHAHILTRCDSSWFGHAHSRIHSTKYVQNRNFFICQSVRIDYWQRTRFVDIYKQKSIDRKTINHQHLLFVSSTIVRCLELRILVYSTYISITICHDCATDTHAIVSICFCTMMIDLFMTYSRMFSTVLFDIRVHLCKHRAKDHRHCTCQHCTCTETSSHQMKCHTCTYT
jgi:hypothetical protein